MILIQLMEDLTPQLTGVLKTEPSGVIATGDTKKQKHGTLWNLASISIDFANWFDLLDTANSFDHFSQLSPKTLTDCNDFLKLKFRGMGTPCSFHIKAFSETLSSQILFLIETNLQFKDMNKIRIALNYHGCITVDTDGQSRGVAPLILTLIFARTLTTI